MSMTKNLPLMGAVFVCIQFGILTIGPIFGLDEAKGEQIIAAIPYVIGYTLGTGGIGVWNASKKRVDAIRKHDGASGKTDRLNPTNARSP